MTKKEKQILTFPATLESFSPRKDGSAGIRYSTQELNEEDWIMVKSFYGKFGRLWFSESEIQPKDIIQDDPEFEGKSPSKRLRNVIFVVWRQRKDEGKTEMPFEQFYSGQLEAIIDQYKSKLNPQ